METEILNTHGEKIKIKIENDKVFVHHEDCTDSFISLDELFLRWILNKEEIFAIYIAVTKMVFN